MTRAATRAEIATDCQKEKKRIPLTHKNFGTGLQFSNLCDHESIRKKLEAYLKGLRSSFTTTQNIAKQYNARQILML